jgi:hypothetical protein
LPFTNIGSMTGHSRATPLFMCPLTSNRHSREIGRERIGTSGIGGSLFTGTEPSRVV